MTINRDQDWFIFAENWESGIATPKEGRCGGILPAAPDFLDGLAEFCPTAGVPDAFAAFPAVPPVRVLAIDN